MFDIQSAKTVDFVQRALVIHGNAYTYENVTYINTHTKVSITCPAHGSFLQTPAMHLFGQGCKKCANHRSRLTLEDFISRSNTMHQSRYDYSNVEYEQLAYATMSKITIGCPVHGLFKQRVHDHLNGHGCKQCSGKSASNKALSWLDHIAEIEGRTIQHAGNVGEFNIPGTRLFADGYCELTNTVYEFDGDAFHGNPTRYACDTRCHPYDKTITASELFQATLIKHDRIRQMGFQLITMWESDFDRSGIVIRTYPHTVDSRIDPTYPLLLESMGLQIVGEYMGSKVKHMLQCMVCSGTFEATPVSKTWTKRRRPDVYGCPRCNNDRANVQKRQSSDYPDRLRALGYVVEGYTNARNRVTLTCTTCGKQKHVTPSAIIQRGVRCCSGEM